MLHIKKETVEQTNKRLISVISSCQFEVCRGFYIYHEFSSSSFLAHFRIDALAVVRDKDTWSQLIPSKEKSTELYKVFSFHFKRGIDNSGFVGWLASYLKHKIGTGVFVVCGFDSQQGGFYDYWGCPAEISDKVIYEVNKLMNLNEIIG